MKGRITVLLALAAVFGTLARAEAAADATPGEARVLYQYDE